MQGKQNRLDSYPRFEECWNRVQNSTNIRKMIELVEITGYSQPYISKMKKKNVFPPDWAYSISQKYPDISIDWILRGIKKYELNTTEDGDLGYWLDGLEAFILEMKGNPKKMKIFEIRFHKAFPEFSEFFMNKLNEWMVVD